MPRFKIGDTILAPHGVSPDHCCRDAAIFPATIIDSFAGGTYPFVIQFHNKELHNGNRWFVSERWGLKRCVLLSARSALITLSWAVIHNDYALGVPLKDIVR